MEELEKLIQDANNYLSGGGCGALSVQEAARLWRDAERKRKLFNEWEIKPEKQYIWF